jgi:hypothetical protein
MLLTEMFLELSDSGVDAVTVATDLRQLSASHPGQNGVLVTRGRPVTLGLRRRGEVQVTSAAEESSPGILHTTKWNSMRSYVVFYDQIVESSVSSWLFRI